MSHGNRNRSDHGNGQALTEKLKVTVFLTIEEKNSYLLSARRTNLHTVSKVIFADNKHLFRSVFMPMFAIKFCLDTEMWLRG